MVGDEICEKEDVGDNIDEIEHDQDVRIVALWDIVCIMGKQEQRGKDAQQEYLVRQCLEGDGVLYFGVGDVAAEWSLPPHVSLQF